MVVMAGGVDVDLGLAGTNCSTSPRLSRRVYLSAGGRGKVPVIYASQEGREEVLRILGDSVT